MPTALNASPQLQPAIHPPWPVFDPSSPIHRFRSVQHPLKICSGFRVTAPLPPPSVTNPAPFIQAWREAIQTDGLLQVRAPSIHARGTADEIKQVAPAPPALCRLLPFLPSWKSFLQILSTIFISPSLSLPLPYLHSQSKKTYFKTLLAPPNSPTTASSRPSIHPSSRPVPESAANRHFHAQPSAGTPPSHSPAKALEPPSATPGVRGRMQLH